MWWKGPILAIATVANALSEKGTGVKTKRKGIMSKKVERSNRQEQGIKAEMGIQQPPSKTKRRIPSTAPYEDSTFEMSELRSALEEIKTRAPILRKTSGTLPHYTSKQVRFALLDEEVDSDFEKSAAPDERYLELLERFNRTKNAIEEDLAGRGADSRLRSAYYAIQEAFGLPSKALKRDYLNTLALFESRQAGKRSMTVAVPEQTLEEASRVDPAVSYLEVAKRRL